MSSTSTKSLSRLGIGVVLLHLLVVVPHGIAHTRLHIEMNAWQSVYIILVINLMPLVAALLLWKRPRQGFLLLLVSMIGSFLFGLYYHFIAPGSDNVATLPVHSWSQTFHWTAMLLAITELAGAALGILGLRINEVRATIRQNL